MYDEWMDGPDGYRAWWEARYGDGASQAAKDGGVHTNVGSEGPPPSPPPKKS